MSRLPETLTSILNKLHAMRAIGFTSFQDAAKAIGHHRQDVSQWVLQREHCPNGHTAILIRGFVTSETLRMAISGKKFQPQYRSAYKDACEKFPINGKKNHK